MDKNDKNIPICECHGIEMSWHRRQERKCGNGRWVCLIKAGERRRKRENSIPGYITKRKYKLGIRRKEIVNQLKELDSVR